MIRNARMVSLSRAAARLAALLLAVPILSLAAPTAAAAEENSDRYAGTYKIDDWRSLEKKSISHMFVLERDGRFLLGAQWSDKEENYFFGTWTLADGRISLNGIGKVRTNQGGWTTRFARTYKIGEKDGWVELTPIPEKNRYGLLGWPNAFVMIAVAGSGTESEGQPAGSD